MREKLRKNENGSKSTGFLNEYQSQRFFLQSRKWDYANESQFCSNFYQKPNIMDDGFQFPNPCCDLIIQKSSTMKTDPLFKYFLVYALKALENIIWKLQLPPFMMFYEGLDSRKTELWITKNSKMDSILSWKLSCTVAQYQQRDGTIFGPIYMQLS